MNQNDDVYNPARIAELEQMLRALVRRIEELDRSGRLLQHAPELLRRMGDVRSELFHYEVRSTYDTPQAAEHRHLVEEARAQQDILNLEPEDDEPWRPPRPE